MSKECYLSTKDNPFNPFERFDDWWRWDLSHATDRRDCCSLLGRFAYTYPDMSDADYNAAIEMAVDDIVQYDPTDTYIKVYKSD